MVQWRNDKLSLCVANLHIVAYIVVVQHPDDVVATLCCPLRHYTPTLSSTTAFTGSQPHYTGAADAAALLEHIATVPHVSHGRNALFNNKPPHGLAITMTDSVRIILPAEVHLLWRIYAGHIVMNLKSHTGLFAKSLGTDRIFSE